MAMAKEIPIHFKSAGKLAAGTLRFRRLSVDEALGRPFLYVLEFYSDTRINHEDLLGHTMGLELDTAGDPRFYHGYVTGLAEIGYKADLFTYRAEIRPWPWLLTRTQDCRIYEGKNVPAILADLFKLYAFADCDDAAVKKGDYPPLEYCVQYRETDFNFVSRLMEEEGIYYYFKQTESKHTLVLIADVKDLKAFPGYEEIENRAGEESAAGEKTLQEWARRRELQSGSYVLNDYEPSNPGAALKAASKITRKHGEAQLAMYDYPGRFNKKGDGERLARFRIEELQARFDVATASGEVRGLAAGHLFTLTDHPDSADNREYLITATRQHIECDQEKFSGGEDVDFSCSTEITAIPSDQIFRPERLATKPIVPGAQTARVVDAGNGAEISPDDLGRVKVHFFWDLHKTREEPSSCWLRVAHPSAHNAYGFYRIPRVGEEVIVEFLEGDPDRPVIVGSLYNGENAYPYSLPGEKTYHGVKTRSSEKGLADDANEIRFEDKKGSEDLLIHAQKNHTIEVESDEETTVGHDQTITVANNRTREVGKDEQVTVKKNQTLAINENRSATVGKDETITISGNRTESVDKDSTTTITKNHKQSVTGESSIDIGKSFTLAVKEDGTETFDGNHSTTVGGDMVVDVKKKQTVTVAKTCTITVGKSSIELKDDGTITITGKDITIDGSGKINIKAGDAITIKGSKVTLD